MASPLITTKLLPPWAHRPAIPRPHLVARRRAGLDGPLTLLCAPAGFGKTALVLQALAEQGLPVAWLSLEPDDSDVTRFAHYLLAALVRAAPELAPTLDPLVQSNLLDLPAALAMLVNLLSERNAGLVLVLEDYHTLEASAVDQALTWLLEHQPLALRLIISSREDPPLPLARLRARGQLTELRGADLRFAPVEAGALIQHLTGLPLSATQAEALVARTEGWAAGLQLASLAATAGDTVATLHRRAANWYAAAIATNGEALLAPALHHALEGQDFEHAAERIEHYGAALNGQGEQARMARWLTRLPAALFARRPQLCLRHAWLLTLTG